MSVAAVIWAVYFAALSAVYLIAFSEHTMPGQTAATWGMAISLAAALLSMPFVIDRQVAQPRFAVAPAVLWTALALLVIASAAVIWVAVNLTQDKDTTGAWALTIVAAAAPMVALLSRFSGPAAAGPAMAPVADPSAAVTKSASAGIAEATLTAEPDGTAVTIAPDSLLPDSHTPDVVIDAEEQGLAAAGVEVLDPGPEILDPGLLDAGAPADLGYLPPESAVVPVRDSGLLSPGWAHRLGANPPRVALDAEFWEVLLAALGQRQTEIGGVALTVRVSGTLIVFGAVLPRQVSATHTFCEFPAEDVVRVRDVVDQVAESLGIDTGDMKITWVHTHPGMGVFLSGTDTATTQQWRAFDPQFMPIVLNPLADHLSRQIGVFGEDNRPIKQVRVVRGLANAEVSDLLRNELANAYGGTGKASAMVLLPGRGL